MPASLTALDLAVIFDTLNESLAFAENGTYFKFTKERREVVLQKVASILDNTAIADVCEKVQG